MIAFLVMFSMFATFFFITLYMQNVEGLSPLETGVRFLPMTVLIIADGAHRREALATGTARAGC